MKLKLPGLRVIKTFLAVTMGMLISYYRPGEGLPFYAGIAAIISLQQDVENTRSIGYNRILGTILGGICGLLYLKFVPFEKLSKPLELVLIALFATIIIWLMANAGKTKALSIMAIVFLSICINHGSDVLPYEFALNRTLDTLIGVLAAIVINWVDFEFREYVHHRQEDIK